MYEYSDHIMLQHVASFELCKHIFDQMALFTLVGSRKVALISGSSSAGYRR